MRNLFVHIGCHKTGTTWLQRYYFPNHPAIRYLNHGPNPDAFRFLLRADEDQWNTGTAKDLLKQMNHDNGGKANLYSEENLSGNLWSACRDSMQIAHRLRQTCESAKIIIVIRSQIEMLRSIFVQYVHEGGWRNIKSFLGDQTLAGKTLMEHLKYAPLINTYIQLFGKNNVHVGIYEEFAADPQGFLEELNLFLAINTIQISERYYAKRANRAYSPVSMSIARFLNRFQKSRFNLRGLPDPRYKLLNKRYWLQEVFDKLIYYKLFSPRAIAIPEQGALLEFYRAPNKELCELTGKDLRRYGYFIG